jgi:hypothetical protein
MKKYVQELLNINFSSSTRYDTVSIYVNIMISHLINYSVIVGSNISK